MRCQQLPTQGAAPQQHKRISIYFAIVEIVDLIFIVVFSYHDLTTTRLNKWVNRTITTHWVKDYSSLQRKILANIYILMWKKFNSRVEWWLADEWGWEGNRVHEKICLRDIKFQLDRPWKFSTQKKYVRWHKINYLHLFISQCMHESKSHIVQHNPIKILTIILMNIRDKRKFLKHSRYLKTSLAFQVLSFMTQGRLTEQELSFYPHPRHPALLSRHATTSQRWLLPKPDLHTFPTILWNDQELMVWEEGRRGNTRIYTTEFLFLRNW